MTIILFFVLGLNNNYSMYNSVIIYINIKKFIIKYSYLYISGEFMHKLSGKRLNSTPHRVIDTSRSKSSEINLDKGRYSTVFFCVPNWDAELDVNNSLHNNNITVDNASEFNEKDFVGDHMPF